MGTSCPTTPRLTSPAAQQPCRRATPRTCSARLSRGPNQQGEVISRPCTAATSRRALLCMGGAAGAASMIPPPPALAGPSSSLALREYKMVLRVLAPQTLVPGDWVSDFSAAMEGMGVVALKPMKGYKEVWDELAGTQAKGRKVSTNVDCVGLPDTWLQPAIARGLLQPIPAARRHRWWSLLSADWRRLVTRDDAGLQSPYGEVYACPSSWGTLLMASHGPRLRRKGLQPPRDWVDLLDPALGGRIALDDSPRVLLAAALGTLGLDPGATAADVARCGVRAGDLRARVRRLRAATRVFGKDGAHVRALEGGDVDVAVGWGDALVGTAQRSTGVVLSAPASGTLLWADLWAVPRGAQGGATDGQPSPLLPAWLELGLQPSRQRRPSVGAASPLLLPPLLGGGQAVPDCDLLSDNAEGASMAARHVLRPHQLPPTRVLQRSRFLTPLDPATEELFQECLVDMDQESVLV
ncbi:hypothetical protein ACKKBG_A03905 [Auxenochlorella protothecoides x Auxenochlorella symbiontica]